MRRGIETSVVTSEVITFSGANEYNTLRERSVVTILSPVAKASTLAKEALPAIESA